jgi:hypothetical protein
MGSISIVLAMRLSASGISFSGPTTYRVGTSPIASAMADFNHDGVVDLVVVNQPNTFEYLQGVGNGTFKPPVSFSSASITSAASCSVTAADFNGDGKMDLAIGSQDDSSVLVYFGNGDGTFTLASQFDTGAPTFGQKASLVAAIDLNKDGHSRSDCDKRIRQLRIRLPE